MKKFLPYIIGFAALILLLCLVLASPRQKQHRFDDRITLQVKDKIPYGTYAVQKLLPSLFPNASFTTSKDGPGYWGDVSASSANHALFFIARSFEPETYELKQIANFARQGNYVFIIAKSLSYQATQFFRVKNSGKLFPSEESDSLQVQLNNPPFRSTTKSFYPGRRFDGYFTVTDSLYAAVLGTDNYNNPNFIQVQSGRGKIFIHLAPLAFSNYFILHKNNVAYFQKAVSLIPQTVTTVLWNEYYLTNHGTNKEKEPNALRVLLRYPSFKAALLTALGVLLLYALLETRRRQRLIPVIKKPANDSLDFVKTIGRLYHDRKDHRNLSKKMAAYFMDYIRTRYKLPTHNLDDAFVQELHQKTAYPVHELKSIVYFIKYVDDASFITEDELSHFYKQLELFYQNT